jgi:hypothetical protein
MAVTKKSESVSQSLSKEWYDLAESSKILNLSEDAILKAVSRYRPLLRIRKDSKDQDSLSREAINTLLSLSKGLNSAPDEILSENGVDPSCSKTRSEKGLWTQILTWRKE